MRAHLDPVPPEILVPQVIGRRRRRMEQFAAAASDFWVVGEVTRDIEYHLEKRGEIVFFLTFFTYHCFTISLIF